MANDKKREMVEIAIDISTLKYYRAWMTLAVPADLDDDQAKALILKGILDGKIDYWEDASCIDEKSDSMKVYKLNRLHQEEGEPW